MRFERVYHPYWDWEEIDHNMWGSVENRSVWVKRAIAFTSDHRKYGRFMRRVIKEWPVSCENALTDPYINRKAWVGHAACALAMGCPEDIVRAAWGKLTSEQQLLANREAERAIREWEHNYGKNRGLCGDVGDQVLFGWDS
jgi:hypothetical protein